MLNVFKQNEYEKLEDHFEEPVEVTKITSHGYQVDSDNSVRMTSNNDLE